MAKPRIFEKPMGVRDFLPEFVSKKKWVEKQVEDCFRSWGYREVITPTLEYFDTVGKASAIEEEKLFKLLDGQGRTLVLRPDQTTPISRVVSTLMKEEPFPIRLCYHSNVFRAQEREAGRNAEFFQSGVELVGDHSPEADAEVVALAVEAMKACGVQNIQVAVGHIRLLNALLEHVVQEPEMIAKLKQSLGRRNLVEFRESVQSLNGSDKKQMVLSLLTMKGGQERLDQLAKMDGGKQVAEEVTHLKAMWHALEDWGVASRVVLDLSLVGSLDYYTGVYFEGYGSEGYYLLSGGRYDRLLEQFDRPASARGFALKTDRLVMASTQGPDHPERVALVYSRNMRYEAFQIANRMRRQGKAVSLFVKESDRSFDSLAGYDRVEEVIGDGNL
ncbi:ATP phosphoribosyltransferase regulatory subunit [Melghirimyces algeriensis]|uniref:ATP phosphoribosyltransferase regulatory subunit n=1 Tax=Melghirimyces algeriensis TaxID=910412 RepID=A0A521D166_9BACL|nr:ATP phosphoribosyltransferase regulatory subunit [Melghirimyces algeriensis]SMO65402.1 ATP phosphoribosyltransferase regulatory subunit [Melghirimyces algeriensis]